MLTARPASLTLRRSTFVRWLSSTPAVPAGTAAVPKSTDGEDGVTTATPPPTAQERQMAMKKSNRYLVYGEPDDDKLLPAPVLPENPAELTKLDPVDLQFRTHMDGTPRTVIIRQEKSSVRQSPMGMEQTWRIVFYEDGIVTEKWTNSLMGWTSNADPYQLNPPLLFPNAADAVYFAKKRGWQYVVHQPMYRYMRRDDAQYQDNFLPIAVANRVKREGKSCKQWERATACTSHYFRPLKYHGDGIVPQHGGPEVPIAPHVPGQYAMR